eukprot:CAMPEP_0183468124 /NCGR_PEP_ID=MMETSP0370-20130417/152210_1 /TAXON_ID=268820 /ORGANISM="Peridinium aciculiferum, Strain PAER-2" /LENGTH=112 /DNA_ID=CAMNT_0025660499 /DNA_START=42 /DNA_END=376 /DNA_ORIENTATION=-
MALGALSSAILGLKLEFPVSWRECAEQVVTATQVGRVSGISTPPPWPVSKVPLWTAAARPPTTASGTSTAVVAPPPSASASFMPRLPSVAGTPLPSGPFQALPPPPALEGRP